MVAERGQAERCDENGGAHAEDGRTTIGAFGRGADKNVVGTRSAAWRFITSVVIKGNKRQAAYTREHAVNVEVELQKICDGILALESARCVSGIVEAVADHRASAPLTKRRP